jgi:hypothetical protein
METIIEVKLPGFVAAFRRAGAKRLTALQWEAMDRKLVMAVFEHVASVSRRKPDKETSPKS